MLGSFLYPNQIYRDVGREDVPQPSDNVGGQNNLENFFAQFAWKKNKVFTKVNAFLLDHEHGLMRSDPLKISITLTLFVKPKRALFYYSWCNIWKAGKFKRWALVQASAQSEVLYLIVDLFLKIMRHHFEGKICQRKGPADYSPHLVAVIDPKPTPVLLFGNHIKKEKVVFKSIFFHTPDTICYM